MPQRLPPCRSWNRANRIAMALFFGLTLLHPGRSDAEQRQAKGEGSDPAAEPFKIMFDKDFLAELQVAGKRQLEIMDTPDVATFRRTYGSGRFHGHLTYGPGTNAEQIAKFLGECESFTTRTVAQPSRAGPQAEDVIWPGFDNPFVNNARRVRKASYGRKLYSAICLFSEATTSLYPVEKHAPAWEEIEWRILAAIGADVDGLLWRGDPKGAPWESQWKQLAAALAAQAQELAAAKPVKWVQEPASHPCSVLASTNRLYIVLLNRDYMILNKDGTDLVTPLRSGAKSGKIRLQVPDGVTVRSGSYLSGRPVRIASEQSETIVEYRFTGGGDMLVLELAATTAGTAKGGSPASEPAREPVEPDEVEP